MTTSQLLELQAAMDEEHRLDREALARLMRFLPSSDDSPNEMPAMQAITSQHVKKRKTIPDQMTAIDGKFLNALRSKPNHQWTVAEMVETVKEQGYEFYEGANPNVIAQRALRNLRAHSLVDVVQESAGRRPGIYRLTEKAINDRQAALT